jgi:hypothetical protein
LAASPNPPFTPVGISCSYVFDSRRFPLPSDNFVCIAVRVPIENDCWIFKDAEEKSPFFCPQQKDVLGR